MIRQLCREVGTDPEGEAEERFGCKLEELSKRAASQFIESPKGTDDGEAQDCGPVPAPQSNGTTAEIAAQDEKAKPQVKPPKAYARPLAEIMADLSKPIAPKHLRQKDVTNRKTG